MGKKERISRTCPVCGNNFQLLECQTKHGRGVYCSKSCKNEGNKNRHQIERRRNNDKTTKPTRHLHLPNLRRNSPGMPMENRRKVRSFARCWAV